MGEYTNWNVYISTDHVCNIIKMDETQIMKEWYYRGDVKFNMIQYTKNREMVLMTPKHRKPTVALRNRRVHNIQGIDYYKSFAKSRGSPVMQFYYSMAKYEKGLPFINSENVESVKADWKENHYKSMTEYDCLIDVDAPNHDYFEIAKETTQQIIKHLQKRNIQFYLRYSGMGFHIIIPYKQFPNYHYYSLNPFDDKNIYSEMIEFNKDLYDKYSELIDCNLNDSRRIAKIPYSLAFYPKQVYVCISLTLKEFEQSTLDYFKYENWKNKNIYNRGEQLIK